MKRIKSIRLRLTLWYIATIVALIITLGIIAFVSLRAILVEKLDDTLSHGAMVIAESLLDYQLIDKEDPLSLFDGEDIFANEIDEEANDVGALYAQLRVFTNSYNPVATLVAKTSTLQNQSLPLSEYAYQTIQARSYSTESIKDVSFVPIRMITMFVHDQAGQPYILQLGLSLQETRTNLGSLLMVFAILLPLLVLSISILSHVFMKRAFQPVRKMVAVAKSITVEDLSLRLSDLDSRDEIGELAGTLNDMIARLEASFNQIQQFSADVSHELKTPLAQLKCNAEVALRRPRTEDEYREVLKSLVEDTQRLQRIVEELLFLARIDSQNIPLSFAAVPLHEVVLEVFERENPFAKQKKLVLAFQEMQQVSVNGDRGMLKMLFTNLMKNAIQYTRKGGKLSFALIREAGRAEFTLADNGVGIPKEDLPKIFDRFYRIDPSRSQETGGSGLGLAIVKGIVRVHGGEIHVQSVEGKGSTFRVILPALVFTR
jgi:heavy metal sensor kinase